MHLELNRGRVLVQGPVGLAGKACMPESGAAKDQLSDQKTESISLASPTCFLSAKLEGRLFAGLKGNAVYARESIARGELLAVWGGALITGSDFEALPAPHRRLALQVEESLYILTEKEGPADWVNHSCDPNAGVVGQIALVAMRDIPPGEEICFDYAMTDSSSYDEFECRCGTDFCRKKVTGSDWQLPELQLRYKGFFSSYIERKIAQSS